MFFVKVCWTILFVYLKMILFLFCFLGGGALSIFFAGGGCQYWYVPIDGSESSFQLQLTMPPKMSEELKGFIFIGIISITAASNRRSVGLKSRYEHGLNPRSQRWEQKQSAVGSFVPKRDPVRARARERDGVRMCARVCQRKTEPSTEAVFRIQQCVKRIERLGCWLTPHRWIHKKWRDRLRTTSL